MLTAPLASRSTDGDNMLMANRIKTFCRQFPPQFRYQMNQTV